MAALIAVDTGGAGSVTIQDIAVNGGVSIV